ncbi:2-dehydropantoate 2-reductase [Vibrio cholerae]|uniref:2-dehydropantoate 2-reductase n=1 Tax=Vibrio cholerae TaxID=666 RepID=UPI0000EF8A15|nr:2-dehydropantoate 2-reductase [Vibrio cholerae]EGR0556272.1 2-dehydropantoate 2-reductase [Vibrio cholerae]EGR1036826.1 2-dehydropantoate 2-reductase [Vibrio cholerae]EGR4286083.1 2-dehydropantoate 2-reductase [Vibrio cholerae]EGR4490267.1 2-dehydropantoate 2-reductase [Vibrio cholerae]EGR4493184.1 2-dehydropantoate 2-reductase [Vibrio cholerae]
MNIVVLGPGAVGSLWALHLHRAGHQVALWSRQSQPTLELQLDDSEPVLFSNQSLEILANADLLLITVKVWQVEAALLPLLPHLNRDTILLFMHNGMGAVEAISESLACFPVLFATTTHGALKTTLNQVRHTGFGQTQVGPFNALGARCDFIADVFNHALAPVTWNPEIQQALWRKLAVNCAINPLTAIHQCANGALVAPEFTPLITAILDEVTAVMQAEAISGEAEELRDGVYQVIQATAANLSSMHQDVFHRRPTEIDFITGYVVRKGEQHGIATPVNSELYQQIKTLEQSWSKA